jgi:hypothetical protein
MRSEQQLSRNGHAPLTLPPYFNIKAVACGFIVVQAAVPRAPSFWVVGCPVFDKERVMLSKNTAAWQNI